MHGVVHSIMAGLFGSCLLPEDKLLALRLLRYLTELQLVPSENPRRYVLCVKEINSQMVILHKEVENTSINHRMQLWKYTEVCAAFKQ
jgi:hypothetical protein